MEHNKCLKPPTRNSCHGLWANLLSIGDLANVGGFCRTRHHILGADDGLSVLSWSLLFPMDLRLKKTVLFFKSDIEVFNLFYAENLFWHWDHHWHKYWWCPFNLAGGWIGKLPPKLTVVFPSPPLTSYCIVEYGSRETFFTSKKTRVHCHDRFR